MPLYLFCLLKIANNLHRIPYVLFLFSIVFSDLQIFNIKIEFEILILSILALVTLAELNKGESFGSRRGNKIDLLTVSFGILTIYLCLQSLIGAVSYWRGLFGFHWFLLFAAFGYLACRGYLFGGRFNPESQLADIRKTIFWSFHFYLLLILVLELIPLEAFSALNLNRPVTTLLLPITLCLPIVFLSIKHGSVIERWAAYVAWLLCFALTFLASSRATLIPLVIGSLLGSVHIFNFAKTFRALLVALPIAFGAVVYSWDSITESDLYAAIEATWQDAFSVFEDGSTDIEESHDADRLIHLAVTAELMLSDSRLGLVGTGFRTSGVYLAAPLLKWYQEHLPHLDFEEELGDAEDVVTFGIPALLIELGLLGVVLILFCWFTLFRRILAYSTGAWRMLLLLTLSALPLRLIGNNVLDAPLFYLAFAPGGLIVFFAEGYGQKAVKRAANAVST